MLSRFNFVKNSNSLPPSPAKTAIGQPFIELTEVESTNMYAMEQLQAGMAAHGAAFFAHHQTAGKGQRGKTWETEPGAGIALTVITDSSFIPISNPFQWSVAAALATYDFFSNYAGDETSLKWPNDLYWRDRKAGGILVENILRGQQWPWSITGIGINVNQTQFPASAGRPVSLRQITGKQFDPAGLARELCDCLEQRYRLLQAGQFEKLLEEYNRHLYMAGQKTRLKKDNIIFNCVIESVSANGELLVSGGNRFRFGEVEWRGE
jgi:BirA family biotin operon repressor/biotin-[acetyl-CoA-carboxylase] ligase